MLPINLPPFEYNLKSENDQQFIFDIIRKKYVINTSEEWVRQHFVHFLINHRHYSKNLIRLESGLNYLKKKKRTDIEVYDQLGSLQIIIECKAPNIQLNAKVINQILQYHKVLQAKILGITNGLEHVFVALNGSEKVEYLTDLPFSAPNINR